MDIDRIYKIPDNIIKNIIRNEVIFTSCDIVKELIDNAIDAKATIIEIHINSNNIKVKDNGIGMNMNDLLLCTNEYTTSKSTDLLNTLGFRGMALYNIKQICSLFIQTRTAYNNICLYMKQEKIEYIHGDTGTVVYCNDINLHISSHAQITTLIKKYVICYEDIKFRLSINNKLYSYTKQQLLFDNHHGIYEFQGEDFHGTIIKNNKNMFYIYINKHCIFNQFIHNSIMHAWKQTTSGKENISYCIYINLPCNHISMSSGKNHIEITKENLYDQIHTSVIETLKSGFTSISCAHQNAKHLSFRQIKYLNTLQNRYIICADEKYDLIMIDAHAAHERIVAEQFKTKQYYMQTLLSEIILQIDNASIILNKQLEIICKYYIQDNFIFITHVINILYYLNEELLIMFERIIYEQNTNANTILCDFFHQYGCKNSMRHHNYLSQQDCEEIINQLFQCDNYEFCNHGRRTYYRITNQEINKIFERS